MLTVLADSLTKSAFPIDKSVQHATTGNFIMDIFPLLTMLPTVPTLMLYWRKQRYADLALFLVGFWFAAIYHICQLHPEGLTAAQALGLPGPVWRTLDIIGAQALLARTVGHALGASTQLVSGLANLAFPAALMALGHVMGGLSLAVCSKVLLWIMLATLAAKVAIEGWHTVPKYCPQRGKKVLACYVLGFSFFVLPEVFVGSYWLFHSLWHIAMSLAYFELYNILLEAEQREDEARAAGAHGKAAGKAH